jgi:hypothetical protein
VALARRDSDPVGLRAVWPDACQVLISQPVDLFTLLPLGELTVAAARPRRAPPGRRPPGRGRPAAGRLGDPPLWSLPLHWSRLHAAILAGQATEAGRHADTLTGWPRTIPMPSTGWPRPGGWIAVMTDRIDPEQIESAARGLAATGLAWDGARLAGQAAIRTGDRKAMTWLLDCARALQGGRAAGERAEDGAGRVGTAVAQRAGTAGGRAGGRRAAPTAGGRALFLSAKTVEHHVARIRQRLGCTDRRELLARLRELLADQTDGAPAWSASTPGSAPG